MSFPRASHRGSGQSRPARTLQRWAVAAAAVLGAAALAAPAHANLAVTGPMDPLSGFPAWYEDANGTRLQICIGDPLCPSAPPVLEPVAPNDEAFYSVVNADLAGPAGQSVTMMFAVEAATPDAPITFGRVEVTMKGMQPDSDYTITYPYGTDVWTTDANGNILSGFRAGQRHEAGCFAGFATPCDLTLNTEIGPFLTWDPAESAPPAGYIGDGTTAHTVVGTANNFVRVNGPGLPPAGITTNRFTVEGRLAVPPFPIFFAAPGSGDFGTQRVNTTATRTVTIKNNGLASSLPITSTALSGPGAANYAIGTDPCAGAAIASGATCSVDVSFTPGSEGALAASLDLIDSGAAHSVPLAGTGGQSGLTATPAVVNFLNHNVSTTSPEQTLTLKNTGPVSLNVSNLAISGANAAEFAISRNGCTAAVSSGDTCTVGLKFLPGATGARNASLDITTDAPGGSNTVPLTGTGTIAPGSSTIAPLAPSTRVRPLAVANLSVPSRLSRRAARRGGLRVSMRLPKGTSTVTLRLYRVVGNKRRHIGTVARVAQHAGRYELRLNSAKLRRRLVPGRYVLEVTPSAGAGQPGTKTTKGFRVTR